MDSLKYIFEKGKLSAIGKCHKVNFHSMDQYCCFVGDESQIFEQLTFEKVEMTSSVRYVIAMNLRTADDSPHLLHTGYPDNTQTLCRRWFNVGPASQTMAQH